MTFLQQTFLRARGLAPVISVGVVLTFPLWVKRDAALAVHDTVSEADVSAAVEAAPFRIGRWVGADVPLPEAAGQQLRPTAALSRRYVHMDHRYAVDVMIIRSGDARDMVGHHPPICYPSNGWARVDSFNEPVDLKLDGLAIKAQRYEFNRRSDVGDLAHIRVFNFFVLPDGLVTPSISDVHQRTSWLRAASPGVTQVQVLTQIDLPEPVAREVTGEILGGLTQVFEAVGVVFHGTSQ